MYYHRDQNKSAFHQVCESLLMHTAVTTYKTWLRNIHVVISFWFPRVTLSLSLPISLSHSPSFSLPLHLYFSQKQLPREMQPRLVIIKCAGYIFRHFLFLFLSCSSLPIVTILLTKITATKYSPRTLWKLSATPITLQIILWEVYRFSV